MGEEQGVSQQHTVEDCQQDGCAHQATQGCHSAQRLEAW